MGAKPLFSHRSHGGKKSPCLQNIRSPRDPHRERTFIWRHHSYVLEGNKVGRIPYYYITNALSESPLWTEIIVLA